MQIAFVFVHKISFRAQFQKGLFPGVDIMVFVSRVAIDRIEGSFSQFHQHNLNQNSLKGICEIAPQLVHPVFGKKVSELPVAVPDKESVQPL